MSREEQMAGKKLQTYNALNTSFLIKERTLALNTKYPQGGVLAQDGYIYAVPSNARGILRIDSRPESQTSVHKHDSSRIAIIGELPDTKDKWQGGFLVENGNIYGIPENCDGILEVKPPKKDGEDVVVRIL